jgi:hypothetical protein
MGKRRQKRYCPPALIAYIPTDQQTPCETLQYEISFVKTVLAEKSIPTLRADVPGNAWGRKPLALLLVFLCGASCFIYSLHDNPPYRILSSTENENHGRQAFRWMLENAGGEGLRAMQGSLFLDSILIGSESSRFLSLWLAFWMQPSPGHHFRGFHAVSFFRKDMDYFYLIKKNHSGLLLDARMQPLGDMSRIVVPGDGEQQLFRKYITGHRVKTYRLISWNLRIRYFTRKSPLSATKRQKREVFM